MARNTKTDLKLNNMENIIAVILLDVTSFEQVIKFDGITIEFMCKNESEIDKSIKYMEKWVTNHKILPYLVEKSKDNNRKFIIQFPDLVPEYTEEEITKMYIANFKWLLDDTMNNKPDLTKQYIIDHTINFVKLAITTYYRSNVNQYKEKLEDYLTNTMYRQKLNMLFMTYVEEYFANR